MRLKMRLSGLKHLKIEIIDNYAIHTVSCDELGLYQVVTNTIDSCTVKELKDYGLTQVAYRMARV